MNKILCLCLLYGLVINLAFPATASKDCNFPAIFNFGDSNSDTGALSASLVEAITPYGSTFFNMPSGRFADGRLIIDFMAEHLGLELVDAYLDALGTNFSNGTNFASASSTIRLPDSVIPKGSFSPFYLEVQYTQFMQFKRRSQMIRQQGGVFASLMPKEEHFSEALYTFDIGQNDLGAGFFGNLTIEQVNASVPDIIGTFSENFKRIYNVSGGRTFWVHNTGPIGCLPYIFLNFPSEKDAAGCSKPHNEVCQYFNAKLKEAIVELRKELPEASITYVDVYTPKYSIFLHPEQYGFEDPFKICCGNGGGFIFGEEVGCGRTITANGVSITGGSCDNPSVRVNWDGVHYTEAANRFVFDQISTGEFPDPPVPLKRACNAGRLQDSDTDNSKPDIYW